MSEALNVKYPNVPVHCCALSDTIGESIFQFVPETPTWSGLRAQPYPGEKRRQQISVIIQRLDDIYPAEFPVSFIKIDVEGAELEVLRGASQTLRNAKPVVLFECGKIHYLHYATTFRKVYEESCPEKRQNFNKAFRYQIFALMKKMQHKNPSISCFKIP